MLILDLEMMNFQLFVFSFNLVIWPIGYASLAILGTVASGALVFGWGMGGGLAALGCQVAASRAPWLVASHVRWPSTSKMLRVPPHRSQNWVRTEKTICTSLDFLQRFSVSGGRFDSFLAMGIAHMRTWKLESSGCSRPIQSNP